MSSWTDERVKLLKKLWADGLTASQIADRLGDVSRNAVIGMRRRLNLPGRRTGPPKKVEPKKPKPRASRNTFFIAPSSRPLPNFKPKLQVHEDAPAPLMLDILDINEKTCKWPVTSTLPHKFCGHEKQSGVPYCDFHRCRASARMMGQ